MSFLDSMSDGQRKLLMYGAPAVAALVVGSRLRKPEDPGPPTATLPNTLTGGTGEAIGVSQLASFENSYAAALAALQESLGQQGSASGNTPPATNTTTPTPAPGTSWSSTDLYRQAQGWAPPEPDTPYLQTRTQLVDLGGPGSYEVVTYLPTAPKGSWQPGYVWDGQTQQWRAP